MKTNVFKKIATGIVVTAIMAIGSVSAFAADTTATGTGTVNGNVTLNGSISPLTISVSHPLTADYAINPNLSGDAMFVSPDITVKNLTKVPVNISVASLKATAGGSITFTDVAPTDKVWSELNTVDSKKFIALGVKVKNSEGWSAGYNTETHYAVKETASKMGVLENNAIGKLSLTSNFGLAFDTASTAKHALVFEFNLV